MLSSEPQVPVLRSSCGWRSPGAFFSCARSQVFQHIVAYAIWPCIMELSLAWDFWWPGSVQKSSGCCLSMDWGYFLAFLPVWVSPLGLPLSLVSGARCFPSCRVEQTHSLPFCLWATCYRHKGQYCCEGEPPHSRLWRGRLSPPGLGKQSFHITVSSSAGGFLLWIQLCLCCILLCSGQMGCFPCFSCLCQQLPAVALATERCSWPVRYMCALFITWTCWCLHYVKIKGVAEKCYCCNRCKTLYSLKLLYLFAWFVVWKKGLHKMIAINGTWRHGR